MTDWMVNGLFPLWGTYLIYVCYYYLKWLSVCLDITTTDVVDFTVAHVTGGNMELIQPLEVTETHVHINIQGLSPFSLLKSKRQKARGRNAQILLFYKGSMNKLHIHLLQRDVKAKEVICFNEYVYF